MSEQNRSGILPWDEENIRQAPGSVGVYVLRESASLEGIIYVGSSAGLLTRLLDHWSQGDVPGVKFFDWYLFDSIEQAQSQERAWIQQYKPRYNDYLKS